MADAGEVLDLLLTQIHADHVCFHPACHVASVRDGVYVFDVCCSVVVTETNTVIPCAQPTTSSGELLRVFVIIGCASVDLRRFV